jgi:hypothetical protein
MCQTIVYRDTEIETIGELRGLFPFLAIPIDEIYKQPADELPDHCCLCPVDFEELEKIMGWEFTRGALDPMQYFVTKEMRG